MRNTLRTLKPAGLATTGLTALGAAGIAATALAGTAHAEAPAKPAAKPAAIESAASTAQHVSMQAAHAKKAQKADDQGTGAKKYADNLDGWIREARAIMAKHDIPGSYEGIKRNIIRESAGDPNAVNDWDINAKKGTPSKGLLQVIQPTFDRFHVEGTPD
ncbi:transglycosylase SLT domain-containing protein, partial [Streptomyces sp. 3N207]|uniref:transglycosylase SLT domain-containing protein n=1 Tax=Streptomyces sp. 3N207 TaxID=3457417 RepID=UPI003FCF445F